MSKKILSALAMVMALVMMMSSAMARTTLGIGKLATADGSTVITHTCDSTGDDSRLWIIPRMEGGEGVMRDIVLNGNQYGDWSDYPNTKNYGGGMVVGEMPQPEDTYQYLHTNYSLINEKGVAMGESTCTPNFTDERGLKCYEVMVQGSTGIIDCYHAQHVALERATTAREAVEIIGAMVEEYGWYGFCENINICDGNETWIMECYGHNVWCAFRVPDDAMFVCGNRARINYVDLEDKENYLCSENIISFAIENGLWSEDNIAEFSPADAYSYNTNPYAYRREWRAMNLVCPSMELDPESPVQPLLCYPEKKLTVADIRAINSDYYKGTAYDVTLTPEAGPFGNVLTDKLKERTINLYRATYHTIATVNAALPEEARSLVWIGWGAADSSYSIPLWASMTELPEILVNGHRYTTFDRDSAWWISQYVQQTASQNYESAIKDIHAARDPKMEEQYAEVASIQAAAAALVEAGNKEAAVKLITDYAYNNAIEWHEFWTELGDKLYAKYMFNRIDMNEAKYPEWWTNILESAPDKPVEEVPAA